MAAESYLQHAEHYYRIIAAAHQAQQAQMGGAPADDRDDEDEDFDPTSDRFTFRPPQSMVAAQGGQPPYSGERSGEFAGEAGEGGEEGGAQPSGERPQGPRPPFNDRNRDRNRDRNFRPRNEGDRFGGERFGARPPRPVESEQPDVGGELPAFLTNPGRPAPIEGEGGEGEGEGDGQRLGFRNRRRRRRGPREGGEGGGFENEPSNAETDPV